MVVRFAWVLVLGLLAGGSTWLLNELDEQQRRTSARARHVPDLYMNRFTTRVMAPSGRLLRRIEATHMAHYPDTETNEFSNPHVIMYREADGDPWHIESSEGWLSADGDTMRFLGDVRIWREGAGGKHLVDLVTRDLEVLPEREYAETSEPVRIRTRSSNTRGVGMRAYLGEGRIELLSDVHTLYENPRP